MQRVRVPAKDGRPALALAWHVRDDGVLWHNGSTGGTTTVWDIDVDSGCAVVVLANANGFEDDAAVNEALRACQAETEPEPEAETATTGPRAVLPSTTTPALR